MWRDPSDNSTSVITMPAAAGREVLPQLLRVYNYAHCSSAENYILLKLVLHIVEKQNIDSSSVVQLLVKPDISSHPPQLPLRPNVQALRYLNFGQFRTPSNFGNCRPWDFCLLTRGHFVLSKQTCRVSLRPKSEKRMVCCICPRGGEEQKGQNTSSTWTLWMGTWSIIITRCIEFRVSILTTPFLRGADSSHIFLVILTPNTPSAKDTMTGWTVQHIKKDRFVWEKKADRNFKRTFHFRILWPSSSQDFGGLLYQC